MRGVLALLACLALLAAPAQAQKLPAKPPAAKSATSALRGALDASPTPAEKAPPVLAPLPPLLAPLATAPPPPDANRCKLTCASDYYFCSANNGSDDCPTTWSQCRAACVAPSIRRDPPTIPAP